MYRSTCQTFFGMSNRSILYVIKNKIRAWVDYELFNVIDNIYSFKFSLFQKINFNDIFIVYTNKIKKTKKEINALDIDVKTKYVKSIYKFVNDYLYLYSKEKFFSSFDLSSIIIPLSGELSLI